MHRQIPCSGGFRTDSERRIVLLGFKESGKSSTGNTILGSDGFDLKKHAECVKKEGVVAGWQTSVIDTPALRTNTASVTPKLCRYEAVRSVTLCPPGPHALLFVVNIAVSMEISKDAVIEHLQLFGERVWKHLMVLFTHGDQLQQHIQQYIECEGEPLKWLLDKCGNRFHVFNNKAKGDSRQVAELLKKIDEMVAINDGSHLELDKETLSFLAQKQREYEEYEQCFGNLKLMKGYEQKLAELRIVLIGHESTSSTADTILKKKRESDRQSDLISISKKAVIYKPKTVGRWQVTVVVTPGWLRDWAETSKRDKLEIARGVSLCPPGPQAFLLVIPACTTFTEADENAIIERMELLGDKVWNHIIVVFTRASWMGDTPIELYVTSEGEPLIRILKKCRNRYHVISNMSEDRSQVETLLEKIEEMAAGNKNCFYELDENNQKDLKVDGYEDETEGATGSTCQLPSDDPKEDLGQKERKRKYKSISTLDESSEYGTAASDCDSAKLIRPNY